MDISETFTPDISSDEAKRSLRSLIASWGYAPVEINEEKPWGAYYRLDASDSERFITEFFPGLSYHDACLGKAGIELSPKFLLVSPGHRLSWQYHDRRAERWIFLTSGGYVRSKDDDESTQIEASAGDSIQFAAGERHRLCSLGGYVVVAEIWQHIDPQHLSDEDDIVRLEDDYSR